ncbi:MAG TPA: hypothetical protein VK166_18315 [Chitinophagaceae bacterium]|nr:hypothetical protein [Chitinophagaceae bacterium]
MRLRGGKGRRFPVNYEQVAGSRLQVAEKYTGTWNLEPATWNLEPATC